MKLCWRPWSTTISNDTKSISALSQKAEENMKRLTESNWMNGFDVSLKKLP